MIISISGTPGSGKSTLAKELARRLGWPRYYIGGLRRERAKELGLTLAEYNALGEKDPRTDREVDEYQKKLGEKNDNFIIEGRTSWLFIPHSIKIYIYAGEKTAAARIAGELKNGSGRNEGAGGFAPAQALKSIRQRMASDRRRYRQYYDVDVYNPAHYDFSLDTSRLTPEKTAQIVYDYINKKRQIKTA